MLQDLQNYTVGGVNESAQEAEGESSGDTEGAKVKVEEVAQDERNGQFLKTNYF